MCDPVREHRFRSCNTVYSVYFVHGLYEGFVELLLFANLAWRALSWCRRTFVRPPDDIEKSVTHRLHCAMPLSGNFAIQAKYLLQSSVNLHFLFGVIFFNGGFAISYPEQENNMENSARKLSEERWRFSNRNPPPMTRH